MLEQIHPLFLPSFVCPSHLEASLPGAALTFLSLQMANLVLGKNQKRPFLDALVDRSWERWWNCSRKAGGLS